MNPPFESIPAAPPRVSAWIVWALAGVLVMGTFGITGFYKTNDDPLMGLIAAGLESRDGPSPRLLYSHIAIGYALAWCYRIWPNGDWYAGYLTGVHWLAHTAMFSLFLRWWPGSRGWVACGVWFGAVGLPWLAPIHFTTTAVLAYIAGAALAIDALSSGDDRNRLGRMLRQPAWWAGAGLMVLCDLIRSEAFELGAVMLGPVVLGLAAVRRSRAVAMSLAALICLVGTATAGLNVWQQRAYRDGAEWQEFCDNVWWPTALMNNAERLSFFPANPLFADKSTQTEFQRRLQSAGWSVSDYQLMQLWFFDDREVFSTERLQRVFRAVFPATDETARRMLLLGVGAVLATVSMLACWPVLMASVCLAWRQRPALPAFGIAGAVAAVALVLMAYLKAYRKLPDWVFQPLAFSPLFAMLWWIAGTRSSNALAGCRRLSFAEWRLAACLIAVSLWSVGRDGERTALLQAQVRFRDDLRRAPFDPAARYVVNHSQLFSYLPPFADLSLLRSWHWVALDGHQRDPRHERLLGSWGWKDVSHGLRTDPQARLVSDRLYVTALQRFFNEHYGPNWQIVPEWKGRTFTIYKLVGASDSAKSPGAGDSPEERNPTESFDAVSNGVP